MPLLRSTLLRTSFSLALLSLALASLTGCLVLDSAGPADSAVIVDHLKIDVRSSQHAIAGASIQLYEADLTTYTGASIARLPYPLLTGKDGNYTASTVLVCNPHSLFYFVATGGDAGGGPDPGIALITAVGSCSALATSTIVLNEATTVATAYALSGFMSSPTSVSANATVGANNGTALALTGITNAFATVSNLVDIQTGLVLATTPASNGTVPQAKLDSLSNLLAACIQSPGFSSTPCAGLTANAPSLAGVAPTDTAQAILNIAHNPGAHIPALAALLPAAPYTPALTAAPNDLTLSIVYKGSGSGGYQAIAADSNGHIWTGSSSTQDASNPGLVTEFDPLGKGASTYSGSSTGISYPIAIAIDPTGNVWVTNCQGPSIRGYGGSILTGLTKIASGGSPILNIPRNSVYYCSPGLASDGLGNIYFAYGSGFAAHPQYVEKYSNAGTPAGGNFPLDNTNEYFPPVSLTVSSAGPVSIVDLVGGTNSFTSNGVLITQSMGERFGFPPTLNAGGAFDHAGNFFWVAEQIYSRAVAYGGLLREIPANPASTHSFQDNTGGLSLPQAVIVDGAGTQWVSNIYGFSPTYPTLYPANVSAFTATGAVFSPATGFQAGLACGSFGIAIDTAGNVWVADQCSPLLAEYVGAATPVTPLAIGVRDNTVAQRP